MQVKINSSAYSSSFHDILHSWDRYIIAYGGRGSGKTDTFYLKYLLSLFEPYYFRLAYVNKESSSIRDSQFAGFKRVAKRIGVYDKLKFYNGDYRIVNEDNGNALIPKGMDDPEKTKGLDDVTAIWWDEINKGKLEDYTALNALLRSPKAEYLQFAISFNPVSEDHWLRHHFFAEEDRHKLNEKYEDKALLHRSTYLDNEFIDQEEYYETLLINASKDKNRITVDVEGEWGVVDNDNPWLYAFEPEKHISKLAAFKPDHPIYISFDFNNSPFEATVWQFSPSLTNQYSFIHCIDEFSGAFKIDEMCQRIKTKYPKSIMFVTGDRSGSNEDIGRNQTAYQLIQQHLRLSNKQLQLNTYNLEHSDSRILCNMLFANYDKIRISPDCKKLIRQCEIAKVDIKSSKPHHLLKDRGTYAMDAFDSMRYAFQTWFHDFVKQAYILKK